MLEGLVEIEEPGKKLTIVNVAPLKTFKTGGLVLVSTQSCPLYGAGLVGALEPTVKPS